MVGVVLRLGVLTCRTDDSGWFPLLHWHQLLIHIWVRFGQDGAQIRIDALGLNFLRTGGIRLVQAGRNASNMWLFLVTFWAFVKYGSVAQEFEQIPWVKFGGYALL